MSRGYRPFPPQFLICCRLSLRASRPQSQVAADRARWASGKPARAWMATKVHSPYWEGSGGNITLSTTRAATFTMVSSSSYETTVIATAQSRFPFVTATVVATAKILDGRVHTERPICACRSQPITNVR